MRLALVVGRDLGPSRSWGIVVRSLLDSGHTIVAAAQELPPDMPSSGPLEVFPRDVITGYYREIAVHPESPKKLTKYFSRSDYPETHSILMGMLSRRDSTGTFRVVDREVVLRELQLALLSQLLRAKPTHIVFEETPHEVVDFALLRLASWLRIPTLFFQPSLVGPQVIARTGISEILECDVSLMSGKSSKSARDQVKRISLSAIEKLKSGGGTALLDRQKRVDQRTSGVVQKIRASRFALKKVVSMEPAVLTNLTGHDRFSPLLKRFLEVTLEWSLRTSFVRRVRSLPENPAGNGKYALFALHYEPERTNMPEGLPFLSQLDAVLAARAFLPEDVTLVVKEHYAQQSSSLRGYVGRSAEAYRWLSEIPGVHVIGVAQSSKNLLKSAECVFTMTGKIGIEAAFHGIPAIYMGQPWWRGMPGSHAFDNLKKWTDVANAQCPTAQQVSRWFETQVSDRLLTGLGGTSPEKYSARISPLPPEYELLEAESILSALQKFEISSRRN